MTIPFNYPHTTGDEFTNMREAVREGHLSGNGKYTHLCQHWLENITGCSKALLTHSCTAALEMAAILAGIGPGDEVIMPSFTFVSAANAVVLRGATPVFIDIRPDTLNIDESLVSTAITPRTKAISVMHYAGVLCDMDSFLKISRKHNLILMEDAAQSLLSTYKSKHAGTFGQLAAVSFHETKNIISGEGGALLINDPNLVERAEIIWEKGTDRARFFRGQVDKYTWVDIGSSYLPSELIAAFLWAQLEYSVAITEKRLKIWQQYHSAFATLETQGLLRRPIIPGDCVANGHIYYLLLPDHKQQTELLKKLNSMQIGGVFHYIPLHSSPAGLKYGRIAGSMDHTNDLSKRLIRLPLWIDMNESQIGNIISTVKKYIK